MERLEPPAQWVSIPVQEFERLHGEVRRLAGVVGVLDREVERLLEQATIAEMRIAELDASNERLRKVIDEIAAEDDE